MGKSLVERDDDIAVRGDTINLSTQRMIQALAAKNGQDPLTRSVYQVGVISIAFDDQVAKNINWKFPN